ncbi:hypothetical protein D9611_012612 [Ephemerocybe angulata]|uniref:BTB domain-containing protein n=1 Tax=Ephemerocybe angulata TaxID=980116 RepID=A0A8H5AVG3_9AGAR|nr:hypothetical protein D9611_012612 [Tulosesus angulatus]
MSSVTDDTPEHTSKDAASGPEATCCPLEPDCTLQVDVILKSSVDGSLIGAHRKCLEVFSNGFPTSDSVTPSLDPVPLSEDGDTLRLLMKFMHNQRYPDMSSLDLATIFDLGEAAEKYIVHSAIAMCREFIKCELFLSLPKSHKETDEAFRGTVTTHPAMSLCYAVKFDYPGIANAAAPYTITTSLEDMEEISKMDHRLLYAWLRYRQISLVAAEKALNPAPYYNAKGHMHDSESRGLIESVADESFSLCAYSEYADVLTPCMACWKRAVQWRRDIGKGLLSVPQFWAFFRGFFTDLIWNATGNY